MDIFKRALWGAWGLLLDGYAVCVALIAAMALLVVVVL